MTDILTEICKKKRIELKETKLRCSFSTLEKIVQNKKNRGFKDLLINLQNKKNNNIIAEIKKRSPSAGIIIQNYFPEYIAIDYTKEGPIVMVRLLGACAGCSMSAQTMTMGIERLVKERFPEVSQVISV